ncbi:hypothetical protein [Nocardioides litoris]|uniref:hypothetical protein n=1 Tax=Nocardioides litoris TaxID=1926648 RepID=UPI0011231BE4|nr:hypothetical protein [Nocardioides litoris]
MTEPLWRPHASQVSTAPVADAAPRRQPRPVDVTVTVLLLVVLAPLAFVAMVLGLLTGMGVSSCEGREPCGTVLTGGTAVMTVAPALLWLVALVWAVVRMVRGRLAWWLAPGAFLAWMALAAAYVGLASLLVP